MSEYKNDSSNLSNEEILVPQEEADNGFSEYDIMDVVIEDKKPEIITVTEETENTEKLPLKGAENVVSVLPPYKRETVERTDDDILEITKKRNAKSRDYDISSKASKDDELYKEVGLDFDIDELFNDFNEKLKEVDESEKDTEKNAENAEGTINFDAVKPTEDEYDRDAEISSTRFFKLPKRSEDKKDIGSTRYFNIKNIKPDKNEAQQRLKASRKNLMQNFRVLSKNKGEDEAIIEAIPTGEGKGSMMDNIKAGEDLFDAVEKAQKKKRRSFREDKKQAVLSGKVAVGELKDTLKTKKIKMIILGVLLIVTFILSFIPSALGNNPDIKKLPSLSAFAILHIICLLASAIVAKDYIYSSALSVYYMAFDADTCLIVSFVLTLLHNVLNIVLSSKIFLPDAHFYTSIAIFAILMRLFGDCLKTSTSLDAVETLIESDGITCIDTVDSKSDCSVLAHGLSKDGKPQILYCAEADMNVGVSTDIATVKNEEKYYSYSTFGLIAVSLIAGAFFSFKTKDIVSFFTAFLSTMSICLPVMCDTSASLLSFFENKKLKKLGAAATDYETIHEIGKSNAIVMDSSDIFVGRVSKFRRVPKSKIAKSDSVVFASSTLKKANSILSDCFDEFIENMGIELPEAEDFAYEEGLGYSCWIADRRVLVGNRQMLIEHSIPAPTEYEEKQYGGKSAVMYVAVEGELTATFVASYKVISKARKAARKFSSTGLVLMLTSKEPGLREKNIASALGISVTNVKLVSSKGIGIMEKYRENRSMRKSAGAFCGRNSGSLLALCSASHGIYTSNKLLFIIHIICQIVAAVLMLLCVLSNISAFFAPAIIIIYLISWSVLGIAITQKDILIKFFKNIISSLGKKGK